MSQLRGSNKSLVENGSRFEDRAGRTYILQDFKQPGDDDGILEIKLPLMDEDTNQVFTLNTMVKTSINIPIMAMVQRGRFTLSVNIELDSSKNPIYVYAYHEFGMANIRKIS